MSDSISSDPRDTTPESIFDLEGSLRRMGGDSKLLDDLVGFFFMDSPELLERIRAAIRDNQPATLERAAHSLKGLAANFGAKRTIEAAGELERMGHTANLSQAAAAMPLLEREVEQLKQALALYQGEPQP